MRPEQNLHIYDLNLANFCFFSRMYGSIVESDLIYSLAFPEIMEMKYLYIKEKLELILRKYHEMTVFL